MDPVFGPILSVRDATTGALAELPNVPSFEAQFNDGVAIRSPVSLGWLEDGRLLYEYTEHAFQFQPGEFQVAINILTGQTEPVSITPPAFDIGCRFAEVTVVGTEDGASIHQINGSRLLDYSASGWIVFTC